MKRETKQTFLALTLLISLLSVLPLISAGVCSGQNCNANINLTISNIAPKIPNVYDVSAVTLNGGTTKIVTILFNATDDNGYADLDMTQAQVSLSKGGETTRTSTSCGAIENQTLLSVISCTITMQFYDGAGVWDISATIKDKAGQTATNDTTTATINSLDYVTQNVNAVFWTSATLGANDVEADNTITLTNGGNQNYATTQITGQNATGQSLSDIINANRFSVDSSTGQTAGQIYMASNSAIDVSAKLTLNTHSASSTEEIFFYVDVPSGIRADNYLSNSAWTIALS